MNAAKVEKRRGEEIHAYIGENGSGKSLACAADTIPSLQAGRTVLSTMAFVDPDDDSSSVDQRRRRWTEIGWPFVDLNTVDDKVPGKLPHPCFVPLTSWPQLLEAESADIVIDEVLGVASSRLSQSLPPAIINKMHQLRRDDCLCRWTSPSFARADVGLREVTKAVTFCMGYLGLDVPGRMWSANRLFWWRTYDAFDYDEWDARDREDIKARIRALHWRSSNGGGPQEWYDTLAPVARIITVSEGGTCLYCGGRRRRESCSCPDDHDAPDLAAHAARAVA